MELAFLAVYYLGSLAVGIGLSVVWGKATNAVLRSRGYFDNWFWLGFFIGPAALLFALMKPDISHRTEASTTGESNYFVRNNNGYNGASESNYFVRDQEKRPGYWTCSCGRQNPPYTGTCGCGFCKY